MCVIETHKFSVFYLAGEFARHLQRQAQDDYPENLFTDGDVVCVQIAGLCHDLGISLVQDLIDILLMLYIEPQPS